MTRPQITPHRTVTSGNVALDLTCYFDARFVPAEGPSARTEGGLTQTEGRATETNRRLRQTEGAATGTNGRSRQTEDGLTRTEGCLTRKEGRDAPGSTGRRF